MHILKIILLSAVGVGVAAFALFVFVVNRIGDSKDGWNG
jgi:hypothetical protein